MIENAVELRNILAEELDIYQELLELAKDKSKLLVERYPTGLQSLVEQEEGLVQQLVELEPRRQEQVVSIVGKTTVKLEELVGKVSDEAVKTELIDIGSKLRETVEEIRVINEGNQRLAQQALEITQQTLKIMTRAPKPVTYGPRGGMRTPQPLAGRSLIDRKA